MSGCRRLSNYSARRNAATLAWGPTLRSEVMTLKQTLCAQMGGHYPTFMWREAGRPVIATADSSSLSAGHRRETNPLNF